MKKFLTHPLTFDLCIALIVLLASSRVTEWQWSVVYTLLAFMLPLLYQVFSRFEDLAIRMEELPDHAARNVTSHDIFRTLSITRDLLQIIEKDDRLFTEIARDRVSELKTELGKLKNLEHKAVGEEVFDIYSELIAELENGDEYWATTYVDDAFWDQLGARKFLKCNEEALERGAKIIRVFLYTREVADLPDSKPFNSYPVVKHHLELRERLGERGCNLELYKFDTSKADPPSYQVVEDRGILRGRYVMNLNGDARSPRKEAIISRNDLRVQKRRFEHLLKHGELETVELAEI